VKHGASNGQKKEAPLSPLLSPSFLKEGRKGTKPQAQATTTSLRRRGQLLFTFPSNTSNRLRRGRKKRERGKERRALVLGYEPEKKGRGEGKTRSLALPPVLEKRGGKKKEGRDFARNPSQGGKKRKRKLTNNAAAHCYLRPFRRTERRGEEKKKRRGRGDPHAASRKKKKTKKGEKKESGSTSRSWSLFTGRASTRTGGREGEKKNRR